MKPPTANAAPEALCEWLAQLRQQHLDARVGLCLEQPAVHLIPFLEAYAWITLHPINPITLQKYREAFVTSRAKDDTQDAEYLADLLLTHHAQLPVWAPQDSATRAVQQLVVHRRAVVDERTALSHRLIALLKQNRSRALTQCASRAPPLRCRCAPRGQRLTPKNLTDIPRPHWTTLRGAPVAFSHISRTALFQGQLSALVGFIPAHRGEYKLAIVGAAVSERLAGDHVVRQA